MVTVNQVGPSKNREFAKVLRRLRNEKGISQENLSLEANLARTYISLLERELRSPSLQTINKICYVLNILPSSFMELIEEEEKQKKVGHNNENRDKSNILNSYLTDTIGKSFSLLLIDTANLKIKYANSNFINSINSTNSELNNRSITELISTKSEENLKIAFKKMYNLKYDTCDIVFKNDNDGVKFQAIVLPYGKDLFENALIILFNTFLKVDTTNNINHKNENLGLAAILSKQIVWSWDFTDNTIKFVTQKEDSTTSSEKTLNYSDIFSKIHPEDQIKVSLAAKQYFNNESSFFEIEFRQLTKDKNWRWIYSRGKIIKKDINNNPLQMLGTSFDITRRKQSEKTLQSNGARLESLLKLNHLMDNQIDELPTYVIKEMLNLTQSYYSMIFVIDENGKIKLSACSDNVNKDLKIDTDAFNCKMIPGHLCDLLKSNRSQISNSPTALKSQNKKLVIARFMSYPIIEKNSIKLIAVVANKYSDYDQADIRQLSLLIQGFWKFFQQKKKQLNSEISNQKKIKISSTLSTMSGFSSLLNSEIQKPLSDIKDYTHMLNNLPKMTKQAQTKEIQNLSSKIDQTVSKISKIVSCFKNLSYANSEKLFLQDIPINEILENVECILKAKINKLGIELNIIDKTDNAHIDCIPSKIFKALMNLLELLIIDLTNKENQKIKIQIDENAKETNLKIYDSNNTFSKFQVMSISPLQFDSSDESFLQYSSAEELINEHQGNFTYTNDKNGPILKISIPKKQAPVN